MKFQLISALLISFLSTAASATVIPFGPASAGGSGPVINFNDIATATGTSSDATITVNIKGDFDWVGEFVDVSLDGFSLGRILDNNTNNDAFNFAHDQGNQSHSIVTGSAIIDQSIFASLISDGLLDLVFDTSAAVNCCGTVQHLSGSISFNEVVDVPEPGTLALIGLGLAGLGLSRRKVKS